MAALNFPSRVAFVDADGRLTPEALRLLGVLIQRTGGTTGDSGVDVFADVLGAASDSQVLPMDTISPPVEAPLYSEMIQQSETWGYEAPEIYQGAS